MNDPGPITIALRIPGQWSHPMELIRNMPKGCRLTGEELILADGMKFDFGALDADKQFAGIFRHSCRRPATDEEQAKVDSYKVNICLQGPGGSLESAHSMMQAAAAILQAGGQGVFIDNSTVAHGGSDWLALAEDGSPDALSFAYVAIVGGKTDVWTQGMHILGLADILMKRTDADEFDIIEVIRYLCRSEVPVADNHILADLEGPRFKTFTQPAPKELAGSPLHNPFGRLKLVSIRDLPENN